MEATLEQWGVAYAKAILEYLDIAYQEFEVESQKESCEEMLYRVQIGAYKEKKNAETMLQKVGNAGFLGTIVLG